MASYVDISRDEFEGWLNSTKFRGKWSQKRGTAGIFVLPLSETVAIELSSSLSGKGETMGHGEASMSMKLVSLITGQTLNKVAQGQNHWKRTINWAKNLEVGLDRMEDAYRKSSAFYDAIAAIKDRTEYKATNMAKIEAVTGWEKNPFLHDLHERLDRDGILTGKQLEALDRATQARPSVQPQPEPARAVDTNLLGQIRALYAIARERGNNWLMDFSKSIGEQIKAGRDLSPRQGEILDRLIGENQDAIGQVLRRNPQLTRAASAERIASAYLFGRPSGVKYPKPGATC